MRRNKRIAVAIVSVGVGVAAWFDHYFDGPVIDAAVDLVTALLNQGEIQ